MIGVDVGYYVPMRYLLQGYDSLNELKPIDEITEKDINSITSKLNEVINRMNFMLEEIKKVKIPDVR